MAKRKKKYPKMPKTTNVDTLKRYHAKVKEVAAYNKAIDDEMDKRKKQNADVSKLMADFRAIKTAPFKKPKLRKRPKQTASMDTLKRFEAYLKDMIKDAKKMESEAKSLASLKGQIQKSKV